MGLHPPLFNQFTITTRKSVTIVKIALTFDVEKDCPPFFTSTHGVEEGLPEILKLLDKFGIKSTFFVTGDVAEKYPNAISKISKKHEIGCHGYHHESFDKIDREKKETIKKSKELLESIINGEVLGFRAPRLLICNELYRVLEDLGFRYDSSMASFMPSHRNIKVDIPEFKLVVSNVTLRFPGGPTIFKKVCRKNLFPVLFFHPWEAIDMRKFLPRAPKNFFLRPDNWFNTGEPFLKKLRSLLGDLTDEFDFVFLRDMIK